MQTFLVDKNSRLDVFLAKKLNQSRNQVALLIEKDCVQVNDKIQDKNSFKLKNGDIISIASLKLYDEIKPQFEVDFDIDILYEDEDLLVLNKPSNLVVHGASSVKNATLVDWLIEKKYTLSNLGGEIRAGLVHRLDKDTSGAILIAKNNFTHQKLSEQLADKSMGRIYLALIDLPLKEDKIIVEKFLMRSPSNAIKKIAIDNENKFSKNAKSAFINVVKTENLTLMAAKLFTGRTHQIRAHLASLNRHILGDSLYGYKGKYDCRIMLHAYFLYFIHPKTKEQIFVKAPLMEDFKNIMFEQINLGENNEKISLEFLLEFFNSFA
ncbi:RluA family pseudouridine synthase [Campylobacter jejuni]|uniref:Pseudouridine synthase n=1 Tax=Campylobacter jejuni TaxID=197 RepID=A0A690UW59_CAMJU|nr:RluA family pseudouridine synthase [Campylobacter jejuni]SQE24743.1 ribosomal large subunit pseudouridine synthase D [Campylobacter jejuni subsp. doylei]EAJ5193810.1 RluA family pseudouridine synthase [Campylobacter jejuni]EAK0343597.1 RluA family pseudouridine synthase [Campylobacter jejuni]EAK0573141.1 RluA family pseudouridine synthase [Campylobacter jejuni]EDP7701642.1 RluA family pseudouridine synthase [Campylobacter jejuni]